jgi:hypothetical protein
VALAPHDVHPGAEAELYVPAVQAVQTVLPSSAHFPATQAVQVVFALAPKVAEDVPAEHP